MSEVSVKDMVQFVERARILVTRVRHPDELSAGSMARSPVGVEER
jgi:hypothetical protein